MLLQKNFNVFNSVGHLAIYYQSCWHELYLQEVQVTKNTEHILTKFLVFAFFHAFLLSITSTVLQGFLDLPQYKLTESSHQDLWE